MRILPPEQLAETDFWIRDLEIFPESWTKRQHFAAYAKEPRSTSAIFLVATDIRVIFTPQVGAPITAERGALVWIPEEIRYRVEVEGGSENRIDTYTLNSACLTCRETGFSSPITFFYSRMIGIDSLRAALAS